MTSGHRQRTTIGRGRCTAQTTSRDTVNKSHKATDDGDDDDDQIGEERLDRGMLMLMLLLRN